MVVAVSDVIYQLECDLIPVNSHLMRVAPSPVHPGFYPLTHHQMSINYISCTV